MVDRTEARKILQDALEESGYRAYSRLMRDVVRGQVAVRVAMNAWSPRERFEIVSETDYVNDEGTGLLLDVLDAMNHYGEASFHTKCRDIGNKLVDAAMQYILSTHESDAEEIEMQIERDRRDYEEEERRSWQRDHYSEP